MHCYFGNLITILQCLCKATRIVRSSTGLGGWGPLSFFAFFCRLFWGGFFLFPCLFVSLSQAQDDISGLLAEMRGARGLAAAPLCSKGKGSAAFCDRLLQLLPALAICRWRGNRREEEGRKKKCQQKTTLLQTRWEHSTWPNQSITSVGRRCSTAVEQHTISQSIGHKHMVTNQWHPEDLGGFSRALLVHAWWLHNHTSFHSLEDTNPHPNNLPRKPPRCAY